MAKNEDNMKIFKLNPKAELPTFATDGSACFDLKVCLDKQNKIKTYNQHNRPTEIPVKETIQNGELKLVYQIQPQHRALIPTGLIFDIPEKHFMTVFIRSSMALKNGVILTNSTGIIDSDYVDELFIMITNICDTPVYIYDGDRIAQAKLEKLPAKYELEETNERPIQKTNRIGGLGSTGT